MLLLLSITTGDNHQELKNKILIFEDQKKVRYWSQMTSLSTITLIYKKIRNETGECALGRNAAFLLEQ